MKNLVYGRYNEEEAKRCVFDTVNGIMLEESIDSKNNTDIKDPITATDKLSASVLVLSKLSAEDMQYLYGLLEGGLTSEEKAAAKTLCYSRFNKDEVAQIYELYLKYAK